MQYRVYTYTLGRTQHSRYRRRSHRKRWGSVPAIFWFACLFSLPVFTLFLLYNGFSLYSGSETSSFDSPRYSALFAVPAENFIKNDFTLPAVPAKLEYNSDGAYDFSKPVPVSAPVEDSYFDDAVFIGDSRTEGLILNTGLSNAAAYAHKGLMVDTVFTKPFININGRKVSAVDALKETRFSKVYIMFGINETGWVYSRVFLEKYGDLIDSIRDINPNADIYIQEIMPVSSHISSTHNYITNVKINEYNRMLRGLAEEKLVYYVDTGSAVASKSGELPEDAAVDGIHLVKSYCEKWLDYLKTHTVTKKGGTY